MTAIELSIGPPPPCGRCGREGLLAACVPTALTNGRGQSVPGTLLQVLCAHCDENAPGAGPLIAFLTVHEQITYELAEQFASYVRTWVQRLKTKLDPQELAADEAGWRRGDYD